MADVPSSDHHSSPWAQRGFILAAAFIAALLLLGLALLLGTGGNDSTGTDNQHANRPPSATPPARKTPTPASADSPQAANKSPPSHPKHDGYSSARSPHQMPLVAQGRGSSEVNYASATRS